MAYLRLPDNSYFTIPEGKSPQEAYALAKQKYPEAFEPPKPKDTGFTGALKASTQELKGDVAALLGRTGLMDEAKAEEYRAAQKKKAQDMFAPTEEGWADAPFLKARELLGGSLPYVVAPVVAAGAAKVAAPAAGLAALGAGFGAGAAQYTATNLGRQLDTEEGKALKDTDLLAAGAAAIPQAALDTLSLRLIPGVGRIFGAAGKKITPEMAKEIAQQGMLKTAGAYALQGAKTAGIEGTTEVAQQFLERLQAGLDIADPEARDEYFESFIGGAVLGGTLSVPGKFMERGGAKQLARAEEQRLQDEADAKAEQEKQAAIEAKNVAALVAQQQKTGDMFGDVAGKASPLPEVVETTTVREREKAAQMASVEGLPTYDDVTRTKTQLETLAQQTSARVNAALEAGDTEAYRNLAPQLENLRLAIDATDKQLKALPKPKKEKTQAELEADLSRLQANFKKYTGEAFDKAKLDKIADSIEDTKAKLKDYTAPTQASLFDENAQIERAPTAAEQAQAAQSREVIDAEALQEEIERSRGIADQYMRLPTADEYKAQLKALRDEKVRLEKSGEPWYAKGRLAEVERLIQELTPKTQTAVAAQARGEPVRPVAGIKQEQRAKLDELLTRVEQLQEAPKDKTLVNLADKASQDYIMLALEEMDAERAKQGKGRLSDQQVLGLVQEMRRAFAPVLANKSTGMLMYPDQKPVGTREVSPTLTQQEFLRRDQERRMRPKKGASLVDALLKTSAGIKREDVSPLEAQLEDIKSQFAEGEAEFVLETQYGRPRPETREERAAATKGTSKVEKTADGYRVTEQAALTPREKEAGVKPSEGGVSPDQGELFAEKNQRAVKKEKVEALEKEVASLENKFKAANSGKNIKAALEARRQLEEKKAELKDAREIKLTDLPSIAITRATPQNFMKFLGSAEVMRAKAKLKELAVEAKKKELSTKTPEFDADLLQQIRDQKDYVNAVQGADLLVTQLRLKAAQLWEKTAEKEVLRLKYAIALWKQDLAKPSITEKQRDKATANIAQLQDEIKEVLAPEFRQKVLSEIDALHAQANDLMTADLAFERAVLKSLERKLEKAPKASPAALEISKQLRKAREDNAASEAVQRKMLEDQARAKRLAEQKALEVAEQQRKVVSLPMVDLNVEAKTESYLNLNKDIRDKQEVLSGLKEGTSEYNKVARELAKLKEEKRASVVAVKRKPGKIATVVTPATPEQKRKELLAKEKELAEERKAFREQTNRGLTPQQLEKVIKEFKAQAEVSRKKGNEAAAKRQEASAKRLEKELKSKMDVARMAMRGKKETGKAQPPRMKTGVAKETAAKKTKVDFDEDAIEHGVRYDDYMFVKQGLEFGFKARVENAKTGEGVTQDEANAVIAKVKVPKGLKIVVVNRLSGDLRDAVVAQGMNPDNVRGGVMPNGGVFIVAENHTDVKDLQRTLAHEITGHLGIENLLGEAGMNALIKKITGQYGSVFKLADQLGVGQDALAAFNAAKRIGKTDQQALASAVREMIAHTEESRPDKNFLAKAGEFIKAMVGAVRAALRKIGIDLDISTSDIFKLLRDARKDFDATAPGAYVNKDGEIMFRTVPSTATGEFANVLRTAGNIVAKQKSWRDRLQGELTGLVFQTKYLDRFAPVQKLLDKTRESLKATQLMYFLRMHDQRMAWTSEIASHGAAVLKAAKDGKGLIIESQDGANLQQIAEALKGARVGTPEDTNRMFTLYLLAKRAKRVGIEKLNFSGKVTQPMLDAAIRAVENDAPTKAAFEKASKIYNEYNKGLVNFAVQTGAISKDLGKKLLASEDYVPFYREDPKSGAVMLEIGGAPPIKIGNVADQPYLHELIGGDEAVLDFFTSSLQNTAMMTDLALRNLATRNVAFTLGEMGLLKQGEKEKGIGIRKGEGPLNRPGAHKTIRFKIDGEDHFATVDTDAAGVDSELLVRGLEGVNTALPNVVKMMNIPANLLRKWVTRNPAYALRQVIRDPMNAVMVSGVNTIPVISSLKEISKVIPKIIKGEEVQSTLRARGILGGQVLTGTAEDQKQILTQITSGKAGWESIWAKADQLAIQGDAATRNVMYNNFIKQGLSEMEATLATLEAMNFSKRGISPSLFALSTMVPFMNAQIQGLNVLYSAFAGKMPFSEKLQIKKKLFQRAAMMTGFTLLYAAMMQDDEAYQNANDEEKLGNWFIYVPGVSEPVRVPIPFELGLLFKALPEALANTMFGDDKARDTMSAIGKLAWNAVPISGPQGVKPLLEVAINHSFYTGREIESDRLQRFEPGERYNDRTTELVKAIGQATNISPVKIEYLIRGYLGSVPLAIGSLANPVVRSGESGEKPEGRASELPLFGSFFQPTDAQGLVNKAYKDVEEVNKAKETWKKMEEEGRVKEADAYLDANADVIALASLAGKFRKQMGELTKQEREIKADPTMTPEEKRKALDEIRQDKIQLAKELSSERG